MAPDDRGAPRPQDGMRGFAGGVPTMVNDAPEPTSQTRQGCRCDWDHSLLCDAAVSKIFVGCEEETDRS